MPAKQALKTCNVLLSKVQSLSGSVLGSFEHVVMQAFLKLYFVKVVVSSQLVIWQEKLSRCLPNWNQYLPALRPRGKPHQPAAPNPNTPSVADGAGAAAGSAAAETRIMAPPKPAHFASHASYLAVQNLPSSQEKLHWKSLENFAAFETLKRFLESAQPKQHGSQSTPLADAQALAQMTHKTFQNVQNAQTCLNAETCETCLTLSTCETCLTLSTCQICKTCQTCKTRVTFARHETSALSETFVSCETSANTQSPRQTPTSKVSDKLVHVYACASCSKNSFSCSCGSCVSCASCSSCLFGLPGTCQDIPQRLQTRHNQSQLDVSLHGMYGLLAARQFAAPNAGAFQNDQTLQTAQTAQSVEEEIQLQVAQDKPEKTSSAASSDDSAESAEYAGWYVDCTNPSWSKLTNSQLDDRQYQHHYDLCDGLPDKMNWTSDDDSQPDQSSTSDVDSDVASDVDGRGHIGAFGVLGVLGVLGASGNLGTLGASGSDQKNHQSQLRIDAWATHFVGCSCQSCKPCQKQAGV